MKLIYVCSPYRVENDAILQRNIDYARELTRSALLQGGVPVTPHLYMTQCLDESIGGERKIGLVAGTEILRRCDLVIVGMKYGISEGMAAEIWCAEENGIFIEYTGG